MNSEAVIKSADEGYTSPSECDDDDFRYDPYPQNTTLDSESTVAAPCVDQIPWEKIGQEYCIPKKATSWDDVTIPFPHNVRLYKEQELVPCVPKATFLSDSIHKGAEFVDVIWKENLGRALDITRPNVVPPTCALLENSTVSFMKNAGIVPVVLNLSEFIEHIFHLISGRESITFVFNSDRDCFERNPVIAISGLSPSLLTNYCKDILTLGSLVRKLRIVSASSLCNVDTNTLVFSAFL